MNQENPTGGTRVLWVHREAGDGTPPDSQTARLERALSDVRHCVRRVGNVYHALAVLLTEDSPSTVFVNADEIEPEEFEFFKIVGRRANMPPVYVFGPSGEADAMERALWLGATDRATVALIRQALLGSKPCACGGDPAPVEPTTVDAQPGEQAPPPPSPADEAFHASQRDESIDEAAEHVDAGADPEDFDGESPALRVPWRDYDDQPARQAPPRRPPTPDTPKPDAPKPDAQEPPHEPLLTQEELRALIGDEDQGLDRNDLRDRKDAP